MAIEAVPTSDLPVFPAAGQFRRKLRSDFARVSVTQLMERAPVFIENSVIRMNQTKETCIFLRDSAFGYWSNIHDVP